MKQVEKNRKGFVLAAAAAAMVSAILTGAGARATTVTWTGGDSANWSDPGNWSNAAAPNYYPGDGSGTVTNNTDTALFPDDTVTGVVIDLPSLNIQNIQFTTTKNSYTFTGNPLWLTAAGSVSFNSGTGAGVTEAIDTPVVLEGDYTFINSNPSTSADVLSFGGAITNGAASATALTLDGSAAVNITGNISDGGGSLSIIKNGTGIATLSGTNTYSGATTVNNGVLLFGSAASIGGSGASMNVGANGAVGDSAGLSDPGFLARINNTGTGTLALTAADSSSTLDFTSGSLAAFSGWYLGGGDGSTFTGTIVPTAAGYKFGGNGPLTVGTNLDGAYAVTIGNGASTGAITFTGTNTYTGGTIVNSGTLVVNNSSAIGGSGTDLTVNINGAIASNTGLTDATVLSRINPASTGALAIQAADDATNFDFTTAPFNALPLMSIGALGDQTYTGVITPANSTYRIGGGNGTLTVDSLLSGSNSLVVNGSVALAADNTYTGSTTINASGNVTLSLYGAGTASGSTVQEGLGSGPITLDGGTIYMAGSNGTGTGTTYGALTNNIIVPAGQTGTIYMTVRGSGGAASGGLISNTPSSNTTAFSGSLTGAGTLNLDVIYVRGGVSGDWSAFTGTVNVNASPYSASNFDFRIASNTFSMASTQLNLGDNVAMYLSVNAANPSSTIPIGQLSGTALSNLGGAIGHNAIWQIGGLNTNSTFAGTIYDTTPPSGVTSTAGYAGIAKVGTGTLILTGNNTYHYGTTITAGTLQVGNDGTSGALGAGAVTVTTPGILAFDRSDISTFANAISGTGSVSQIGSGTTDLTGTNTYTGGTVVSAGTLQGTPTSLIGAISNSSIVALDGSGTITASISGSGGVNKVNSGSILLGSAQAYTGATNVSAGSLEFTGANPTAVTVDNGASLTANSSNAFTIGSLSLGSSGSDDVSLDLNPAGTGVTSFSVAGNVTANAAVRLDIGTTGLAAGDYTLISYGGSLLGGGFNQFSLSDLPPRVTAHLVDAANAIDLDVISVDYPKWTGAANGNWDINTTTNWKLAIAGTATTYLQPTVPGDAVVFDDSATGTTNVNITTTVSPTSVTVNNSVLNYTFTGSGISGTANLLKEGTASLTLSNSGNNYTGGTVIQGGTLNTTASDVLPTAGNITITAGALDLGGNNQDLTGTLSLQGGTIQNGSVNETGPDYDMQSGTVEAQLNGSAGLTKSGSGTVVIGVQPNYSGATTVNAGTLQLGDGTNASNGGNDVTIPNAVTVNSDGTLVVDNQNYMVYGGVVSGAGTWTKTGPGTLEVAGSNTNTTTNINQGEVILDDSGGSSSEADSRLGNSYGTVNVAAGATLFANGNYTLGQNSSATFPPAVVLNGGTLTQGDGFSNSIYGLTLNGGDLAGPSDSTWSIHDPVTVPDSPTGGPNILATMSAGSIQLGASETITVGQNSELDMTGTWVNGTYSSSGNTLQTVLTMAGTGIMVVTGSYQNLSTTFAGGEFSAATDDNLGGQNNLNGSPATLTFSGGTLQIRGTALTNIDSYTVNWSSFNGGFDIADPTNVFTVSEEIDGTGALSKLGPGTLVVSGPNTYSGGTTLDAGTLQVPELSSLGTGTVTIDGGMLVITDSSVLATVESDLKTSYDQGAWDKGVFNSDATISAGRTLGYGLVNNQVVVMYTLPGDLDLNGSVNGTDLTMMEAGDGTSWSQGDLNYDSEKNADDWSLFFLGAAYGSLPTAPVPEPGMLGAVLLGAVGLMARRRRG